MLRGILTARTSSKQHTSVTFTPMHTQFWSNPKSLLAASLLLLGYWLATPTLAGTLSTTVVGQLASPAVALARQAKPIEELLPDTSTKMGTQQAKGPAVPRVASGEQEKVPYGNNPLAGKYLNAGDAKLYYEVYGKGKPILLLHGGVYGYIDEFAPFIEKLSLSHQVICLATRGHGKSEMGTTPFTYRQRAEDAYKLIRHLTQDSVTVLGFSDGALAGYKLEAMYPQVVRKLIAIGAGDRPKGARKEKASYSPEGLLGQSKTFFEGRLALMPEPKRWGECLSLLNKLYNEAVLSNETFRQIKCPVLVMGGDQDAYESVEQFAKAAKAIPKSQLSIISGCGHVIFFCNFPAVWEGMRPFVQ